MKYDEKENYNHLLKENIGDRNLLCIHCIYQIYRNFYSNGKPYLSLRCKKCLGAGNMIPISDDYEKYPLFDENLREKHRELRKFQLDIVRRKAMKEFSTIKNETNVNG